jgi:hypothetical protein
MMDHMMGGWMMWGMGLIWLLLLVVPTRRRGFDQISVFQPAALKDVTRCRIAGAAPGRKRACRSHRRSL